MKAILATSQVDREICSRLRMKSDRSAWSNAILMKSFGVCFKTSKKYKNNTFEGICSHAGKSISYFAFI